MSALPTLALDELTRRRHNAARGVAACRMTMEQANLRTGYYAALALYAGATLPADLQAQLRSAHDADPISWWEIRPRGVDPTAYLHAARKELRHAAFTDFLRHKREPSERTLVNARRTIALYRALAQDALGPLPLSLDDDQVEQKAAA